MQEHDLGTYPIPEAKENIKIVTPRPDHFRNLGFPEESFISNDEALAWANDQPILQLDAEAPSLRHFDGFNPYCFQIGRPDHQIILDMYGCLPSAKKYRNPLHVDLSVEEKVEQVIDIAAWREVLEKSDKWILTHNGVYDWVWLAKYGITIPSNRFLDTFLAETSLSLGIRFIRNPETGQVISSYDRDLGAVAMRHIGQDIPKQDQKEIAEKGLSERRFVTYSATDVRYLEPIFRAQLRKAEELGVIGDVFEECKNAVGVAYLQYCGIYLNWEDSDVNNANWITKCNRDDAKVIEHLDKLNAYVKEHFPFHSAYFDKKKDLEKRGVDVDDYVPVSKQEAFDLWVKDNQKVVDQLYRNYLEDLYVNREEKPVAGLHVFIEKYGKVYKEDFIDSLYSKFDITKTEHKPFKKWLQENYPELRKHYLPLDKHQMNWTSGAKVEEFFRFIGIDTTDRKKKSGHSVDIKKLRPQEDKFPILEYYLKLAHALKRTQSYGRNWEKYIQKETGRIHPSYNQNVDTGRMSARPGVQTLPNDAYTRACFRGQGPNYFVSIDYSDQEGHTFAYITQDGTMLIFYKEGLGDKHAYLAAKISEILDKVPVPFEAIKAAKKKPHSKLTEYDKLCLQLRQGAKSYGFAIMYAGDEKTIAKNEGIPLEKALQIKNAIFTAFPGIRDFIEHRKKMVHEEGSILISPVTGKRRFLDELPDIKASERRMEEILSISPSIRKSFSKKGFTKYGYKKKLGIIRAKKGKATADKFKELAEEYNSLSWKVDRFWGDVERQSVNTPSQGLAAMITKRATRYFVDHIITSRRTKSGDLLDKWLAVLSVHDEINAEAHMNSIQKCSDVLQECMIRSAKELVPDLDMKAGPEIAKFWVHN